MTAISRCSVPGCDGTIWGGRCTDCCQPTAHPLTSCPCFRCASERARHGLKPLPTLLDRIYAQQEERRALRWRAS